MIVPGAGFLAGGTGVGGGVDPYIDQRVLMLHLNGTNDSTTFTDEEGHTVTGGAGAKITTSESRFGGASLYARGGVAAHTEITVPYSLDFSFDTNDFTIEMFIKSATNDTNRDFIGLLDDSGGSWANKLHIGYDSSRYLSMRVYSSPASDNTLFSGIHAIPYGSWVHVAVCRKDDTYYGFVDGVLEFSGSRALINHTNNGLTIGDRYPTTDYLVGSLFDGFIDEVRLTNGLARYTSAFTPPTEQFPD